MWKLKFDFWIKVWHSMCGCCSLKIWFQMFLWSVTREINLFQFQVWLLNFDSPNWITHICLLKVRSMRFKYCKPDSLRSDFSGPIFKYSSRNWSWEVDLWKSICEYWCSIWWLSISLSEFHFQKTMFDICFVTSVLTQNETSWSS